MLNYRGLKGTKELVHVVLDASVDGSLGAKDLVKFAKDTIIHEAWYEVETALASAGAATVIVGDADDADGLLVSKLHTALTADYVSEDDDKGAYLLDATNKNKLRKKLAAEKTVQATIGTAALTAGKVHYYFEVSSGY